LSLEIALEDLVPLVEVGVLRELVEIVGILVNK